MFYQLALRALYLLWHFWFHLEINGRENVPNHGGYILASNHCSAIDPMIICQGVWHSKIHFMGKAELFEIPVLKHVIRWLGAFPVSRGSGDMSAIENAIKVLNADKEILGLFPEGTRSKDGSLLRFKSGLALIAQQSGAPVLPVTVTYCGSKKSFRSRVVVNYGKLISCEELGITSVGAAHTDLTHARELKEATRRLHSIMEQLKEENL